MRRNIPRMDGTAYFAIASLVIPLAVGVAMALHPEWRRPGWAIISLCGGTFLWSTSSYLLGQLRWSVGPVSVALELSTGALGTILLGFVGLIIEGRRGGRADHASIRIQFFGDVRLPAVTRRVNIATWFTYFTPHARFEFKDKDGNVLQTHELPKAWAIFLVFDRPTDYRNLTVGFNAPGLPIYDIMQTGERAALVALRGDPPPGELEITTQR